MNLWNDEKQINRLFYKDDIRVFANNERELKNPIQSVKQDMDWNLALISVSC